MRVFLAGATGAIGRRLIPQLVEVGHQVIAITRREEKLAELYDMGAEPVLCDVYNIVDDEPATAAESMPVYAEALGAKRPPRVPAFLARVIAGDALVTWMLGLRGASNEKIEGELGWRPRYESWWQGFFEDVAAAVPGSVQK